MQFASDLDPDTKKRIEGGQRMTEVLKQGRGEPLAFEVQATIIWGAINGYFDDFAPSEVTAAEKKLRDFLAREGVAVLEAIRTSKDIREETETTLHTLFKKFTGRTA